MSHVVTLILVLGASAISVGLIVVLNLFLGGWTPARFTHAGAGVERIEEGVLGFTASHAAVMGQGGRVVLAMEEGGARLGVAATSGDRATVRALAPGDVRAVRLDGATLTLDLTDYTFPRVWLTLEDAETALTWANHARAFVKPAPETARAEAASHA